MLLVVLGYRTNLTMEQLAALFATTDSTVHRVPTSRRTSPPCSARRPPTGRSCGWWTAPLFGCTTSRRRRSRRTTGAA
ncbi:hypothetical protein ACWDSL_15245 [Streptomyces sp. NPDC000941]